MVLGFKQKYQKKRFGNGNSDNNKDIFNLDKIPEYNPELKNKEEVLEKINQKIEDFCKNYSYKQILEILLNSYDYKKGENLINQLPRLKDSKVYIHKQIVDTLYENKKYSFLRGHNNETIKDNKTEEWEKYFIQLVHVDHLGRKSDYYNKFYGDNLESLKEKVYKNRIMYPQKNKLGEFYDTIIIQKISKKFIHEAVQKNYISKWTLEDIAKKSKYQAEFKRKLKRFYKFHYQNLD